MVPLVFVPLNVAGQHVYERGKALTYIKVELPSCHPDDSADENGRS